MRDSNSRDTTNRAIDEGKNQDVLFRADDDRHVMHDGKLANRSRSLLGRQPTVTENKGIDYPP